VRVVYIKDEGSVSYWVVAECECSTKCCTSHMQSLCWCVCGMCWCGSSFVQRVVSYHSLTCCWLLLAASGCLWRGCLPATCWGASLSGPEARLCHSGESCMTQQP
jgi:hypothetical protein